MSGTEDTLMGQVPIHGRSSRQLIHIGGCYFRRVIHNAAAPASEGPLRSIMDNIGDGIRGQKVFFFSQPLPPTVQIRRRSMRLSILPRMIA